LFATLGLVLYPRDAVAPKSPTDPRP
jgi:hypothetical protein